jgi:membrane-associated phospholipid phosphatase
MDKIVYYDKALFKIINANLHNSFFDWIMPWLRNSQMWIPLYLFIILFVLVNYKKEGVWIIVFCIITVVLTDTLSSKIIKPYFGRVRPCNDPTMLTQLRFLLKYKPINGSFTSSHAANHFGIAAFLYFTLQSYLGKWVLLFFLWAFSISFAQVYVGVHFPLDIVAGGLLGFVIGYLCAKRFNNNFSLT